MSGASNTGKRKRRTFWEPDSPAVKRWLDAQSELGVSLQLIITDAIHRYGDGDVIKAHLLEREQPGAVQAAPQREVVSVQPEPIAVQQPAADQEPSAERLVVQPVEPELPKEPVKQVSPEPKRTAPPAVEKVDDAEDDNYDPISIMLGDVGGRLVP